MHLQYAMCGIWYVFILNPISGREIFDKAPQWGANKTIMGALTNHVKNAREAAYSDTP